MNNDQRRKLLLLRSKSIVLLRVLRAFDPVQLKCYAYRDGTETREESFQACVVESRGKYDCEMMKIRHREV